MTSTNPLDRVPQTDRLGAERRQGDSPERLKDLAAQFEAMLVAQMLQTVRASMFEHGEERSDAAPLGDALFAEFSAAICRAKGLGLAEALLAPLQQQSGVAGAASAYGWRRDPIDGGMKFHKGLDIALPFGQDVPAPLAGRVAFAGEAAGYGLSVLVDHGDGPSTRFAHLSELLVNEGDQLAAGQPIGKVGATGRSTGPHLHVEVIQAGQTVNPSERLGTYAGRLVSGT